MSILFILSHPKISIDKVVKVFKSVSTKVVCKEFLGVKNVLCGGNFLKDEYSARMAVNMVTMKIISQYIRFHEEQKSQPELLACFL